MLTQCWIILCQRRIGQVPRVCYNDAALRFVMNLDKHRLNVVLMLELRQKRWPNRSQCMDYVAVKGVCQYVDDNSILFLTFQPPNYLIGIFTRSKLCLADAIHNFKWVKIIQI